MQLRGMLLAGRLSDGGWPGLAWCPAGSLVETVVAAFKQGTDIPLELPFFMTLMFVAADCLARGAMIDLQGQEITPALQWIGLTPSGVGKTFCAGAIERAIGAEIPRFSDAASAAAFLLNLSQQNRSLWLRDEFGSYLKNVETQTHMMELKDYLLRLYDGTTNKRVTKQESIIVEKPALCILGLSVESTWANCVPGDALLDGFAQRFGYFFVGPRDETVAIYDVSPLAARIGEQWRRLQAVPLHPRYAVSAKAREVYTSGFETFLKDIGTTLPQSFFRRVLFSAFRVALVYHRLLLKPDPVIDELDIGWAMRVVRRLLPDAGRMLELYDTSDLRRQVQRVEGLLARARSSGRVLTERDVAQGVLGVRSAVEARALLELVLDGDRAATDAELAAAKGHRRAA